MSLRPRLYLSRSDSNGNRRIFLLTDPTSEEYKMTLAVYAFSENSTKKEK